MTSERQRPAGEDGKLTSVSLLTLGDAQPEPEGLLQLQERLAKAGFTICADGAMADITLIITGDPQTAAQHVAASSVIVPLLLSGTDASGSAPCLFIDDGMSRLRKVIEEAQVRAARPHGDRAVPLAAHDRREAVIKWLDNHGEEKAPAEAFAQSYAMSIAFQRLSLLNAQTDRSSVDALLSRLHDHILRFARDCSSHDMAIFRHDSGFYLLAETLRDRRKWNWMAEEIVTMLHDNSLTADSGLSLGAQIALASRRADENAAPFIARLDAGIEELSDDVSALIKWVDRGSDLPPPHTAKLEHDLANALQQDEILVRFQPQFAMNNGHLTGAEALARWQHPVLGELGAATLFTVAERANMVQPVSAHIQRKALEQAATWPAALSELRLSVNLTAQDLAIPGFAEAMEKTVAASGFDAAKLTLEITETALISDLKRASRLCTELRDGGMRVAIDDFGTGFSSLLYLKSLPVDYLKIDGAISRDIEGSPRDQTIVRSIIALGLALDLEIIAEGVENEPQRDHLAEEGCHYYQGFLGGEALDNITFVKFAMRAN
ncbi:MAG: EAL domain-containing protein [Pseudomonadota bacterium]